MPDRLYRSKDDRIIGGVCGGLAQHLDLDPSLIRIITVLLIFSGISPIFYLIAWLIIPSERELEDSSPGLERVEDSEENSDEEKAE